MLSHHQFCIFLQTLNKLYIGYLKCHFTRICSTFDTYISKGILKWNWTSILLLKICCLVLMLTFFFFLQNFAPQQECIPNSPCSKTIDIIQMISRFNCNCFEREREMIHCQETSSLWEFNKFLSFGQQASYRCEETN